LNMMTIAPELPGNLDVVRWLVNRGVVAAFGHSNASYEEAKEGFEAGIRHVTHLFNAMPSLHHRSPGPLPAIFEEERATLQIISDGHHLHPGVVRLIYRIAGPRRCVCITDGISGMNLPEGRYIYNGKEYESRDGAARYSDGTLIGSTMSLWNIALKFREFTRCSLEEAVDAVTINPARTIGIDSRKGSLATGRDADIVLLEDDLSVAATIVRGTIRYRAPA
jgi:N-acetylglucosamine-6-phosphate deacetylase